MTPQQNNQPIAREPLAWLYEARFEDGHVIKQPSNDEEDVSQTRGDGTGNRFTDVLAYDSKLVAFGLGQVDGEDAVIVDLITGNFEVNGRAVCIHNQYFEPQKYDLELVYFREMRAEQVIDREAKVVSSRHFANRYFIGWKTIVNSEEKQVTMAVG